MKKPILMMLSAIILTATLAIQTAYAQDKKPNWPGVTFKVLTDNDNANISEVTFAPGAVADWHSHPQHTVYAVTDVKMKVEINDKETTTAELKAGEAIWSPAVTHKTTNISTKPFVVIVSEIKEPAQKN